MTSSNTRVWALTLPAAVMWPLPGTTMCTIFRNKYSFLWTRLNGFWELELVSFIPGSQVGCFGGGLPVQGLTVMGSGIYPSPILCPIGPDGKDHNGKYHFTLLETFARSGIIPYVPSLKEIVEEIADSIDSDGICRLPNVAEDLFRIRTFYGLQLETDWRTKTRKACDITFRALLILHYAGMLK
ncbi:MAG: hypothetical protein FWC32_12060 [Firmicutes bacterium]|nr:hypothetical protein [Bacillota bacterium]